MGFGEVMAPGSPFCVVATYSIPAGVEGNVLEGVDIDR